MELKRDNGKPIRAARTNINRTFMELKRLSYFAYRLDSSY